MRRKNRQWLRKDMLKVLTKEETLEWARDLILDNQGIKLVGNRNPLVIDELLWEQCSKWDRLASQHAESVHRACTVFLKALLHEKCAKDVEPKI